LSRSKRSVGPPKIRHETIRLVKAGDLVSVPEPQRRVIEPDAFHAYEGNGSIAQILSGAVEIARRRGYLFMTHREIGAALEARGHLAVLAYSLALAIAVAAGPARATSLCATLIQLTGATVVLQKRSAYSPSIVRDAREVIALVGRCF